jgi:hypothetical protein
MDSKSAGMILVAIGAGLVLLGAIVWTGALSWFGRLPGDIRIEKEGTRVYAPIVSMLVLSIVASVVAYVVRRLWR